MKFAFRVDASSVIGSGHVMRCLTLAESLEQLGHECLFISRDHVGHMGSSIAQRGFDFRLLPSAQTHDVSVCSDHYSDWLGVTKFQDATETIELLTSEEVSWLVVDHYALDASWEEQVRKSGVCKHIMVIDDLGNRDHNCELLLDQNLGSSARDYEGLVPAECRLMLGPEFALLRQTFSALRSSSLNRRKKASLKSIIITMGGADKDNITVRVLEALKNANLGNETVLTVVLGAQAQCIEEVRFVAGMMPWPTKVLHNISDMAERMAEADLAIGAAGSTSWERCALGLPAILVCLAANQKQALQRLADAGAAISIDIENLENELLQGVEVLSNDEVLAGYSNNAANVTDGLGVKRVIEVFNE